MMTDPTANNTIVPLNSKQPIVNADGTPTQFFMRWAQERSIDISGGITYDQLVEILTIAPDPTGSYTNANITVNEYGQIVAASNGVSGVEVTDGTHTEVGVTTITFSGATVSSTGTGEATVTISGGGGGSGFAHGCILYNGSTFDITNCIGISSVTWTSTGRWRINFSSPVASPNYTLLLSGVYGYYSGNSDAPFVAVDRAVPGGGKDINGFNIVGYDIPSGGIYEMAEISFTSTL